MKTFYVTTALYLLFQNNLNTQKCLVSSKCYSSLSSVKSLESLVNIAQNVIFFACIFYNIYQVAQHNLFLLNLQQFGFQNLSTWMTLWYPQIFER